VKRKRNESDSSISDDNEYESDSDDIGSDEFDDNSSNDDQQLTQESDRLISSRPSRNFEKRAIYTVGSDPEEGQSVEDISESSNDEESPPSAKVSGKKNNKNAVSKTPSQDESSVEILSQSSLRKEKKSVVKKPLNGVEKKSTSSAKEAISSQAVSSKSIEKQKKVSF
jgi:hypothetical protein